MITMSKNLGKISETEWGGSTNVSRSGSTCEAWARAECLSTRIDVEPESMVVEGREDILQCPICKHTIVLGADE